MSDTYRALLARRMSGNTPPTTQDVAGNAARATAAKIAYALSRPGNAIAPQPVHTPATQFMASRVIAPGTGPVQTPVPPPRTGPVFDPQVMGRLAADEYARRAAMTNTPEGPGTAAALAPIAYNAFFNRDFNRAYNERYAVNKRDEAQVLSLRDQILTPGTEQNASYQARLNAGFTEEDALAQTLTEFADLTTGEPLAPAPGYPLGGYPGENRTGGTAQDYYQFGRGRTEAIPTGAGTIGPDTIPPVVPDRPPVPQSQELRFLEENTQLPSGNLEPQRAALRTGALAIHTQSQQKEIYDRAYDAAVAQGFDDTRATSLAEQAVSEWSILESRARLADTTPDGHVPLEWLAIFGEIADVPRALVVTEMGANANDVANGHRKDWGADWASIAAGNWTIPGVDNLRLSMDFEKWAEDPMNWPMIREVNDNGFQANEKSPRYTGGRAVWELYINTAGNAYKAVLDLFLDPSILVAAGESTGEDLIERAIVNLADPDASTFGAVLQRTTGELLAGPQRVLNATVDMPFNLLGSAAAVGFRRFRAAKWLADLPLGARETEQINIANEALGQQDRVRGEGIGFDRAADEAYDGPRLDEDPGPPTNGTGPIPPTNGTGPGGNYAPLVPPPASARYGMSADEETGKWIITDPAGMPVEELPYEAPKSYDAEPNRLERDAQRRVNELNRPIVRADDLAMGSVLPPEDANLTWTDPGHERLTTRGKNMPPTIQTKVADDMTRPPEVRQAWMDEWAPKAQKHEATMAAFQRQETNDMLRMGISAERDLVQSGKELLGPKKTFEMLRFYLEDTLIPYLEAFPGSVPPKRRWLTNDTLDRSADSAKNANLLIEHALFGTPDDAGWARKQLRIRGVTIPGYTDKGAFVDKLEEMGRRLHGDGWLSQHPDAVRSRAYRAGKREAQQANGWRANERPPGGKADWDYRDIKAENPNILHSDATAEARFRNRKHNRGYDYRTDTPLNRAGDAVDAPPPRKLTLKERTDRINAPYMTPPAAATPDPVIEAVVKEPPADAAKIAKQLPMGASDQEIARELSDPRTTTVSPGQNRVETTPTGQARVRRPGEIKTKAVDITRDRPRNRYTINARQTGVSKPVESLEHGVAVADEILARSAKGIEPVEEQVTRAIAATEPPVPDGYTRLYRGERVPTGKPDTRKEWIRDAQFNSGRDAAKGRWFTDQRDLAVDYITMNSEDWDVPGRLVYVDVPTDQLDQWRIKNMEPFPLLDANGQPVLRTDNLEPVMLNPRQQAVADPHTHEHEFFLPHEVAGTKAEVARDATTGLVTAPRVSPNGQRFIYVGRSESDMPVRIAEVTRPMDKLLDVNQQPVRSFEVQYASPTATGMSGKGFIWTIDSASEMRGLLNTGDPNDYMDIARNALDKVDQLRARESLGGLPPDYARGTWDVLPDDDIQRMFQEIEDARPYYPGAVETPGQAVSTAKALPAPVSGETTTHVDNLVVDRSTFQNRKAAYSEQSVQNILDGYDPRAFDPIQVKANPDGTFTVLSGHSRHEAWKRLVAQGRVDPNAVPIKVIEGTEEELRRFAQTSNTRGTPNTPTEQGQLLKRLIEDEGIARADAIRQVNVNSADATRLMNLTNLNPGLQDDIDAGRLSVRQGSILGDAVGRGVITPLEADQIFMTRIATEGITDANLKFIMTGLERMKASANISQGDMFGGMDLGGSGMRSTFDDIEALGKQAGELIKQEKNLTTALKNPRIEDVARNSLQRTVDALRSEVAALEERVGFSLRIVPKGVAESLDLGEQARRDILRKKGALVGPADSEIYVLSRDDRSYVGAAHQMGAIDDETYAILNIGVEYSGHPMKLWQAYDQALDWFQDPAQAKAVIAKLAVDPEVRAGMIARRAAQDKRGLTKRILYGALAAYDGTLRLLRESIQFNWARGFSSAFADMVGNAYSLSINGELEAAAHGLDVRTARHFFQDERGRKLVVENLPGMDRHTYLTGTTPPTHVIQLTETRSEVGHQGLILEKLGPLYHVLRPIADRDIKAFRSAMDRQNRFALYMSSFDRNIKLSQNRFRGMVAERARVTGNDYVDWLRRLDDLGNDYNPADVLKAFDDQRLARDWRTMISQSRKDATSRVDELLFSYRQTNADQLLKRVIFFHYWMSRSMPMHAKTTFKNPWLLNMYARAWDRMQAEAEQNGYPPSVRGFVRMMGDQSGFYGLINPINVLVPFSMLIDNNDDPGVYAFLRRWGLFINPLIEAGAASLGWTNQMPDLTGTLALRRAIRYTVNYLNANGHEDLVPDFLGEANTWQPSIIDEAQYRIINSINNFTQRAANGLQPGQSLIGDFEGSSRNAYEYDQMNSILINELEKKYGPFEEWGAESPAWQEYLNARDDIAMGRDGSILADSVVEQMADAKWLNAVESMAVPGGVYQRYGPRDVTLGEAAAQTGGAADDLRALEKSATPELDVPLQQLDRLGTENGRGGYKLWNEIAFDDIPSNSFIMIDGRLIEGSAIHRMTQGQRERLADRWLAQYEGVPEEVEAYRALREPFIKAHPEVGDFKEYQKGVGNMEDQPGGIKGWRTDYAKGDPVFAKEMAKAEERARADGKSGPILDAELDRWALSASAYKAANGMRDEVYDDPIKAKVPEYGFPTAEESKKGGVKKDPMTVLSDHLKGYREKMDLALEALKASGYNLTETDLIGGSPLNRTFLSSFGVPEMDRDVILYLQWASLNPGKSIDDYIIYLEDLGQKAA